MVRHVTGAGTLVAGAVAGVGGVPTVAPPFWGPYCAGMTQRDLLNRSLDSDRETALREEAFAVEINSATQDMKEGLAAFAERRPPRFVGY